MQSGTVVVFGGIRARAPLVPAPRPVPPRIAIDAELAHPVTGLTRAAGDPIIAARCAPAGAGPGTAGPGTKVQRGHTHERRGEL